MKTLNNPTWFPSNVNFSDFQYFQLVIVKQYITSYSSMYTQPPMNFSRAEIVFSFTLLLPLVSTHIRPCQSLLTLANVKFSTNRQTIGTPTEIEFTQYRQESTTLQYPTLYNQNTTTITTTCYYFKTIYYFKTLKWSVHYLHICVFVVTVI